MKFRGILICVVACLAAQAAGNSRQEAPTNKPIAGAQQSLTGCIDEQKGQYVLLDDQMAKIIDLHSAGSDQEVFAKHVGHMVLLKGTKASGQKKVFQVTSIEQVAGHCGQAR